MTYPHTTYAKAVADALADEGIAPDDWDAWSHDGVTMTAVYRWTGEGDTGYNSAAYPNGVLLSWTSDQGWQYARFVDHHQTRTEQPIHLGLDPIATPAAAVRAADWMLSGRRKFPPQAARWKFADALQAALPDEEA
ncbi:hypothetical protein [Streptomyces sp. NPDC015131]|uniref:hypothetical protein n=1 Tax=Streptomyces sp. NPDC015131 TaxID=3364941 RepID=UPI0036FCA52A